MARPSNLLIDLIGSAHDRSWAAGVGASFFHALQPYGVRAIFARSRALGGGGGAILSRISPPGWEALYAERDFEKANYLNRELARRYEPFAWSEITLLNDAERQLNRALRDSGFPDGLAIPWYGPGGVSGVTSLAFERLEAIAPAERSAIEMAALVLHQRMQALAGGERTPATKLSGRERECLALVAGGGADHEIADRLSIAETTVISHLQNARRKLGARTRAQAVAAALMAGLI